ncbi:MAG: prenyltransferase [Candidatus Bathyarchaeota archaeon]|nr:prenyltransferase [Candidatus Bathyarchaeota archaeon]MDH5747039.1 prenyltransferase [Candidatus Bathyarchaeota archaeon]
MLKGLLSLAFKVSRFRFWIYTAGTYIVGYSMGMGTWSDFFNPEYFMYLIYFFLPANVFIYGFNDYWDQKTDKYNPKKNQREYKVNETERRNLLLLLYLMSGISLMLLLFQKNMAEQLVFLSFLLLSYFYSAKPIRFKAIPFLDFASNVLYVMPGILGYYQVSGSFPPILVVFSGFAHTSAMHLFSAIPDIEYDKKAGIITTAVLLKKKLSLLVCFTFWLTLSTIVVFLSNYNPLSFLVFIYPIIPLALLIKRELNIEKIYWYYPFINTSLGLGLGFLFVSLSVGKI